MHQASPSAQVVSSTIQRVILRVCRAWRILWRLWPIVASVTTAYETHGWIASDDTFGARLAMIRQHKGWGNVKEAALACGIPVQSWRTWERDGKQPRYYPYVCQQIAERSGADFSWLLDGRRPGGGEVRREGIEPPTRWLGVPYSQSHFAATESTAA